MTPAVALLVIGGILLVSGWHGSSLVDVFTGNIQPVNDDPTANGSNGSNAQPATQLGPPLNPKSGVVLFEGHKVAAWIAPILRYGRQHGWRGKINSGYRTFDEQTRIWNSGVRPAARPGTSNHEGAAFPRGAVDVDDAATLSRILQSSPYRNTLVWAGAKDPVHFSHPHGGSY